MFPISPIHKVCAFIYSSVAFVGGLALDHSILGLGWKVLLPFIQISLKWH